MGATGWLYTVPYQEDISKALQELREEVFQSEMYKGTVKYEPHQYNLDLLLPEMVENIRAHIRYLESLPKPESIEEAVRRANGDGTHSILDIDSISSEPQFGTASPLHKQELESILGTDKPTRAMIEQGDALEQISYLRARNEAAYIILYKDEQPDQILFTGSTGD